MSEPKTGLGGLFVNKKSAAAMPAASPMAGAPRPKNVKQRWAVIGMVAVGFIVMSSTFFAKKPAPVQVDSSRPTDAVLVSPSTSKVNQQDWMSQTGADFAKIKNENAKLANEMEGLKAAIKAAKDKADADALRPRPPLPSGVVAPPTLEAPGTTGQAPAGVSIPPPPPGYPTGAGNAGIPLKLRAPGGASGLPAYMPAQEPQVFKPDSKPVASSAGVGDGVKSTTKYKKNPYSGYLPAGSFAPVALLNGLDAGTSSATQANPMPVLMTITDQATLPGAAKYSIKSCFVLGTGYGDLSAERVYVRYSRMSCVDRSDHLVLSADVAGYLVDSDGKIGLRGKVLDRQGAKLGKALIAGFAQGLAGALGTAQSVVTTSAVGTTSALGGDNALKASGLAGAQSATQQLAQFYLKEAQAIFPVIAIDAGRTGTIVFTDNTSLAWATSDSQYVKDVRPE